MDRGGDTTGDPATAHSGPGLDQLELLGQSAAGGAEKNELNQCFLCYILLLEGRIQHDINRLEICW